jgi:Spy/CpxP family protein refolding chaperone
MRMFGKLALAVGLTALLSTPAWAQGRGGFGGPGAGGAMLLVNKGVQEELKVTEDQASKLETLSQATRDKMREAMQDVPQEERFQKMAEIGPKIQADVDKGLAEILKPEQVKRFHQIQIQAASYNAFSQPKVAEKLKLTDSQKAKIKEISDYARAARGEIFQSAQDDREGAMKKMQELNKTTFEKVTVLLTPEQKTEWKDLIGAPYEVKFTPRPQ